MSIRVGTNAVFMKGIDAAKFESESSKGIGKLKAIKSFFCGVFIAKNTAQTFTQNHSSKLAKKLDERLIARHNEELKNSRINPRLGEILEDGLFDMEIYDFIRDNYIEHNMETELAELRDLSSDEVFTALQRSGLFEDNILAKISKSGADLEGSPYW